MGKHFIYPNRFPHPNLCFSGVHRGNSSNELTLANDSEMVKTNTLVKSASITSKHNFFEYPPMVLPYKERLKRSRYKAILVRGWQCWNERGWSGTSWDPEFQMWMSSPSSYVSGRHSELYFYCSTREWGIIIIARCARCRRIRPSYCPPDPPTRLPPSWPHSSSSSPPLLTVLLQVVSSLPLALRPSGVPRMPWNSRLHLLSLTRGRRG